MSATPAQTHVSGSPRGCLSIATRNDSGVTPSKTDISTGMVEGCLRPAAAAAGAACCLQPTRSHPTPQRVGMTALLAPRWRAGSRRPRPSPAAANPETYTSRRCRRCRRVGAPARRPVGGGGEREGGCLLAFPQEPAGMEGRRIHPDACQQPAGQHAASSTICNAGWRGAHSRLHPAGVGRGRPAALSPPPTTRRQRRRRRLRPPPAPAATFNLPPDCCLLLPQVSAPVRSARRRRPASSCAGPSLRPTPSRSLRFHGLAWLVLGGGVMRFMCFCCDTSELIRRPNRAASVHLCICLCKWPFVVIGVCPSASCN